MLVRPPALEYRKGELHCERLALSKLAERYGTPLYVYSSAALRERYRIFEQAFQGTPHTICYSVKANSNLSLLRMLSKLGAGFDIVSGGELERVRLAAKNAVKKVVFSGVGKTAPEMELALRAGIMLFNVESEGEIELLGACAARLRTPANVALRVNPDVPAETHPYISTGLHQHKFGIPIAAAPELYRRAAAHKYLNVAGASLHIGSQITDVAPFSLAMERMAELVQQLAADGRHIRFVDAGGGLGISYKSSELGDFPRLAGSYAKAIIGPLRKIRKLQLQVLLEPGRSLVAPAGVLVTRVLYNKKNRNKHFAVVDAAMNDLLRPSLYGALHEIVPVVRNEDSAKPIHMDVVGPICESGDFLARDTVLPVVEPGSYLCILDAGAYGMVLASNYNTRPRAAEVLVEGSRVRIVRRRETIKDLLQHEVTCL
jgi:diaminopimelate decarboxylase